MGAGTILLLAHLGAVKLFINYHRLSVNLDGLLPPSLAVSVLFLSVEIASFEENRILSVLPSEYLHSMPTLNFCGASLPCVGRILEDPVPAYRDMVCHKGEIAYAENPGPEGEING